MRVPVGPAFDDERDRYALCFTCEDCAHALPQAPKTEGEGEPIRCKHGWPTDEHRLRSAQPSGVVSFCKEFELW